MNLRKIVLYAVATSTTLIVILLFHLARSNAISRTIDKTSQLSNQITRTVAELDQLVYDYLLHPHQRPIQQWRLLSDDLSLQFSQLELVGGPNKSIDNLRAELMQAKELFEAMLSGAAKTQAADDVNLVGLNPWRSRLPEQMLLLSRQMVRHAQNIHSAALEEQPRIKKQDDIVTITVLLLIIALMVTLLNYVQGYIVKRLDALRISAERAAAGNLDQTIGDNYQDEIGRLSRSFDHMLIEVRAARQRISNEISLRSSEERQRQMIDALAGLVWAATPDGTIDLCNSAWAETFPTPPDTPGFDWSQLIIPADRPTWSSAWEQALQHGNGFELELRLRHDDGNFWYLIRVAPLKDDLNILRWVCTAVNIHHHKLLEIHLRHSRNQAELLNQVGLDLVGELDIDRLTQRVTDTARALIEAEFSALFYNISDESNNDSYMLYAVSGMPIEAFKSFGMPRATDLFRPTFNGEGVIRSDDIRQDPRYGKNAPHYGIPNGHPPVVSYLAVPVRTRSGVVIGGIFCAHSQAAQFTAQHEQLIRGIAALAATAFDSARLIDAERKQRRLAVRHADELARSNAELEQFAYICSHDLQEPLRMVSSFLSLLNSRYSQNLDDRGQSFVTHAIDGAKRMQALVKDVLAFSRVGHGERAEETCELQSVVGEVAANLQPTIEQSQGRVIYHDLPVVFGNRLQCVQLFQNLISNALKFYDQQPPVVTITARPEGDMWHIRVQDNGIGIDPRQHERIFQVFQRLHGRDQYEGTGIGLSLCKKIVLAHGGTMGVDSAEGTGTTFWFTLPDHERHPSTPSSGSYPQVDGSST